MYLVPLFVRLVFLLTLSSDLAGRFCGDTRSHWLEPWHFNHMCASGLYIVLSPFVWTSKGSADKPQVS